MNVNRRKILKGFSLGASSLILAPLVRKLEAHAAGEKPLARRFVFVIEGNGLNPDQIQPEGIVRAKQADRTKLVDQSLTDVPLPEALEPLADFKNRLTILQGLSGRVCGGGHSNNFGALGCFSSKAGAYAETIDAVLAQHLGGIFPHVGLGITDRPEHSVIYNTTALGRGKPLPIQCQPQLAYSQLFGSVAEGSAQAEFQAKSNLLDFMVDDVQRLESRLAGPEREKLQSYLAAFESMRDRQSRLNEIKDTLRKQAPVVSDKYRSAVETDRLDAHFDIAAAALIGGLTNVVTIASGAGDPYFSVKFTGLGVNVAKHNIGHGGSYNGKSWRELAVMIRRFHMTLIARLATKLAAIPEGDGSMLDNTLIVYLSDAAEAHHSRCWEWPVILLGNIGGRLKTGGRLLDYPYHAQTGHRTMANLYCTLLHTAGAPRDEFGLADANLKHLDQKGPLAELFG